MIDGQVIVHSHPYLHSKNKQNPFQTHAHLPASYVLIQQLMQANWESLPDIPQIPEPEIVYCVYDAVYTFSFISSGLYTYTQLRAPPVG